MAGIRACTALKELRIHLCQTGEKSQGVRDFITNHYVTLKKANPELPILVRECSGVQARVWARYEKGMERTASLSGQSSSDILNTIKQLFK